MSTTHVVSNKFRKPIPRPLTSEGITLETNLLSKEYLSARARDLSTYWGTCDVEGCDEDSSEEDLDTGRELCPKHADMPDAWKT